MNKIILASMFLLPTAVFADFCTDITTEYNNQILTLQQHMNAAILVTTDEDQIRALRESYELQKASLEAQRDSLLMNNNCLDGDLTDSEPPVIEDPVVNNPTDPSDPSDPSNPGDPNTTPDEDTTVNTGHPNDDVDQAMCQAFMEEIKAEARRLAAESGRGFSAGAKYVRSMKPEIQQKCGNFGRGRRHVGGQFRPIDQDQVVSQNSHVRQNVHNNRGRGRGRR